MSCKHKYLPEDLQALQTPWEDDGLIALVNEARVLREEKEAMPRPVRESWEEEEEEEEMWTMERGKIRSFLNKKYSNNKVL